VQCLIHQPGRIRWKLKKSKLDEQISIKICSKKFKQGLIDPDQIFNHDHDRDE